MNAIDQALAEVCVFRTRVSTEEAAECNEIMQRYSSRSPPNALLPSKLTCSLSWLPSSLEKVLENCRIRYDETVSVLRELGYLTTVSVHARNETTYGESSGQTAGKLPHRIAVKPSMTDQITTSTLSPACELASCFYEEESDHTCGVKTIAKLD